MRWCNVGKAEYIAVMYWWSWALGSWEDEAGGRMRLGFDPEPELELVPEPEELRDVEEERGRSDDDDVVVVDAAEEVGGLTGGGRGAAAAACAEGVRSMPSRLCTAPMAAFVDRGDSAGLAAAMAAAAAASAAACRSASAAAASFLTAWIAAE